VQRNIIVDNPIERDYGFYLMAKPARTGCTVRGTRREEVEPNPLSWTKNMIRTIALAVSAIALTVAAPVSAAEMRVKVAGKSAEQVRADIVKAASTVCWQDVRGEALSGYLYPACIRASVSDAIAKINSPALTAYNTANPTSGSVTSR
jgi:uncharacterized protein YdbL (DUF1318 family)